MKQFFAKNKSLIFLAAILLFTVVVIVIALTSKPVESLAGTYQLVDASGSGNEMFEATAGDATLEIRPDNTGTFTMLGQQTAVVAEPQEKKISFNGGKDYSNYTYEKNKLTVENSGYKAVFKKK